MTRLYDNLFGTSACSMSSGDRTHAVPRYVRWRREGPAGRVSWHTDGIPAHVSDAQIKVKWLLEPRDNHPENFEPEALEGFDVIYTHDHKIVENDPRARVYFLGGTRIHESDWGRNYSQWNSPMSIVASSKRGLYGHQVRHLLIQRFPELAAFGPEYTPIREKFEGLCGSYVHVAIEPVKSQWYFSEHLLDAFLMMNLPIYMGADADALAVAGFDLDGLVHCDSRDSLFRTIELYSDPDARYVAYVSKQSHLEHNFRVAHRYTCPEDHLYSLDPTLFEENNG